MLGRRDYQRLLHPLLAQSHGYARSMLRHRQDAEDAVQQAAMRAFERIGTYDRTKPFAGWWFGVLRNCCMDILRTRRVVQFDTLENHDVAALPDRTLQWEALCAAIETLSPDHREILGLRYFAGLSYRELAESLRIPQGTVMSRLHTARLALMSKFPAGDHEID